jgi:hypothetical protein
VPLLPLAPPSDVCPPTLLAPLLPAVAVVPPTPPVPSVPALPAESPE